MEDNDVRPIVLVIVKAIHTTHVGCHVYVGLGMITTTMFGPRVVGIGPCGMDIAPLSRMACYGISSFERT
jgi:hypothetical protein